jgi:hypothetical protein
MQLHALSLASKKKAVNRTKKMSDIAFSKVHLYLSLYSSFRGLDVTVAGKYFKSSGSWNLLVHVEEGRRKNVSEDIKREMNVTAQGGWPLNAQAVVDENYLRYMCGNIEELVGQDLVDLDGLLSNRLYRSLVFNALPNFIDVISSKQKGRMAVKLLKYIEL